MWCGYIAFTIKTDPNLRERPREIVTERYGQVWLLVNRTDISELGNVPIVCPSANSEELHCVFSQVRLGALYGDWAAKSCQAFFGSQPIPSLSCPLGTARNPVPSKHARMAFALLLIFHFTSMIWELNSWLVISWFQMKGRYFSPPGLRFFFFPHLFFY